MEPGEEEAGVEGSVWLEEVCCVGGCRRQVESCREVCSKSGQDVGECGQGCGQGVGEVGWSVRRQSLWRGLV